MRLPLARPGKGVRVGDARDVFEMRMLVVGPRGPRTRFEVADAEDHTRHADQEQTHVAFDGAGGDEPQRSGDRQSSERPTGQIARLADVQTCRPAGVQTHDSQDSLAMGQCHRDWKGGERAMLTEVAVVGREDCCPVYLYGADAIV